MLIDQLIKTYNSLTQLIGWFGGALFGGPIATPLVALAYGTAFAPDMSKANHFIVTIADGVAFAIGAPTNPQAVGQRLSITFRNASGGAAGAGTFNAIYKMASNTLAAIANGFSRTYEFQWNGTNWIEIFQTAADVAN